MHTYIKTFTPLIVITITPFAFQVLFVSVLFDAAHSESHLSVHGPPGETSHPNIQCFIQKEGL